MAWNWRDSRHRVEVEADLRYAAARHRRVLGVSRKLDAVLVEGIKEGRRMSLKGKMAALTESAADFTKETHATLDGISSKIAVAREKRDAAALKHHGYYDGIISGIEESVEAIDRLSNVPLGGDDEMSRRDGED
jgi:hypothetical protein